MDFIGKPFRLEINDRTLNVLDTVTSTDGRRFLILLPPKQNKFINNITFGAYKLDTRHLVIEIGGHTHQLPQP